MKKLIVTFIEFFILFLSFNSAVLATSASVMSLQIPTNMALQQEKVTILTSFLKEKNSPLTPYARTLIEEAEKNELDYRLVPAITGVESSFGKAIPTNSYNAYGWANGDYYFSSWEDGIITVSKTLNEKYKKKWGAQNPYEIGRYYAASPTWASRVIFFMEQIEDATPKLTDLNLNL